VTATVEAFHQVKLADGTLGNRLSFQAWSVRHNIAITPNGPVPYGEVVFREDANVTDEDGTLTFADIRQADGTLVPISVRVRPAMSSVHKSRSFGPVIERVIATPDADDQGLVFLDLETGKSLKPPFPLTFHPNQGPTFVELTPELKQWIKARDVDVLLHLGEKTWDLMTLEMQEGFAGQLNEWETISPKEVIGLFAKKDADHLARDAVPASSFGYSYRDEFGVFNAFRTRSNDGRSPVRGCGQQHQARRGHSVQAGADGFWPERCCAAERPRVSIDPGLGILVVVRSGYACESGNQHTG
jgi:hypothetical protein